jgi:hypothetical protein
MSHPVAPFRIPYRGVGRPQLLPGRHRKSDIVWRMDRKPNVLVWAVYNGKRGRRPDHEKPLVL